MNPIAVHRVGAPKGVARDLTTVSRDARGVPISFAEFNEKE